MKINVRIAALAAAFSLYGAVVAGAQEVPKPKGVDKAARDVSKATKKAGADTKAETKPDASKAHGAVTEAGNDTKKTVKKATGIKAPQSPQPGGLDKMARDVSNTPKKAGSDLKAQTKRAKGAAHGATTEAGKSMKDTVMKSKP